MGFVDWYTTSMGLVTPDKLIGVDKLIRQSSEWYATRRRSERRGGTVRCVTDTSGCLYHVTCSPLTPPDVSQDRAVGCQTARGLLDKEMWFMLVLYSNLVKAHCSKFILFGHSLYILIIWRDKHIWDTNTQCCLYVLMYDYIDVIFVCRVWL